MIDLVHLEIYKRHYGNIDSWGKGSTKTERKILSDKNWEIIDEVKHSLVIIERGLSSGGFRQQIIDRLSEVSSLEAKEFAKILGHDVL
ncbi:hypothetical protein N9772_03490 [Bacteroidia bacterium]|jgi:hypothetical protein|nr:hypothetical protein [Bacteroidia bacterium]